MTPTLDELPTQTEPTTSRGWLWLPMLLLLGYLLFAHGCHGDEDNELFIKFQRAVGASGE
jgi:hypothetical protein